MRRVTALLCTAAITCTSMLTSGQGTPAPPQGNQTPVGAAAPEQRPRRPPENLKVLPADVNILAEMNRVAASLGVKCDFCHVQGNFPSDERSEKQMARRMMQMTKALNANFPKQEKHDGDSVLGSAITCYTCHRGEQKPATNPPPAPPKPGA